MGFRVEGFWGVGFWIGLGFRFEGLGFRLLGLDRFGAFNAPGFCNAGHSNTGGGLGGIAPDHSGMDFCAWGFGVNRVYVEGLASRAWKIIGL